MNDRMDPDCQGIEVKNLLVQECESAELLPAEHADALSAIAELRNMLEDAEIAARNENSKWVAILDEANARIAQILGEI